MQATKPDLKSIELESALKAAAHTRDEASAHGDTTGSVDPTSVRQHAAGTAQAAHPPMRRWCNYCYDDTHVPSKCPKLIIDHLKGNVRAGYALPTNLMRLATLLSRSNTEYNRLVVRRVNL